jgi:RND family efflux transporter MFP subunit
MTDSDTTEGSEPAISSTSLAARVLLPVIFLVVGGAGYVWLSKKPPALAEPRPKPKALEVQVTELKRVDYQIRVPTQGTIQAHSEVSFTAQVAGRVDTIHPEFEAGAFFEKGDVLLELDPVDFEEALVNAKTQVAQAKFNLVQEQVRAKQARLNWEDLGYKEEPTDLVLRIPHVELAKHKLVLAETQKISAERSLKRAKVRAPFDGRVLSRSVGIGQTIGGSAPLGVIFATDYSEVRLPVSTRFLVDISLPEDVTDPPLEVILRDGLAEASELEWKAQILRTEGALDKSTLELFAVARVEDPFGVDSKKVPLRVGQPVTAEIPGRVLKDVFVIPRDAITGLNRIRLVDPETLTLGAATVTQLWADDDQLVFRDLEIEDDTLLVLTRLVYAPDGGKVVIEEDDIPADPDGAAAGSGNSAHSNGKKDAAK